MPHLRRAEEQVRGGEIKRKGGKVCAGCIKRLWTRCKHWVAAAYLAVKTWVKIGVLKCVELIRKIWGARQINGSMASHGFLLLTFALILMLADPRFEMPVWESIDQLKFIPTIPIPVLRIAILLTVLVSAFVFLRRLEQRLKGWLKRALISILLSFLVLWLIPPIPVLFFQVIALTVSSAFLVAVFFKCLASELGKLLKGEFGHIYWAIFLVVFVIGFLEGFPEIPRDNPLRPFVEWFGEIWFFVIVIIYFKAAGLGKLARKVLSLVGSQKSGGVHSD